MLRIEKIFETSKMLFVHPTCFNSEKAKNGRLALKDRIVEQKFEGFGEMQDIRLDDFVRIRVTKISFPKRYISIRERLTGYDIADLMDCGYNQTVV